MIEFFRYVKEYWKYKRIIKSPVWNAARISVNNVMAHTMLNEVSKTDPLLRFCPRCGQIPQGDRRMQDAREQVFKILGEIEVKLSDVDFAMMWHLWRNKNA
jgi:hypothetical protein